MNTLVNFEIAKLLQENGFEGKKSPLWYYKDGTLHKTSTSGYKGLKCWNTWDATQGVRWDAPTIAEVVMWLYEKYGIWISVTKDWDVGKCLGFESIIDTNDGFINTETYNSPTEAYEAAITYCLENLIQGGNK